MNAYQVSFAGCIKILKGWSAAGSRWWCPPGGQICPPCCIGPGDSEGPGSEGNSEGSDTGACGAKLVISTFTGGLELLAWMEISKRSPGMPRSFCSSDNVAHASLPQQIYLPSFIAATDNRIGVTVGGKAPKGLCNVRLLTPTKTCRISIFWMRCFRTAMQE